PGAGRMFWVYGPGEGEITVVGLEPHPEDRKSKGYDRVSLSDLPPVVPTSTPGAQHGNPAGGETAQKNERSRRRKR
ncbi:MAG TPA: hypothetical protein VK358_06960, partial [Longimicrobium sp.]|nr:hypothetical protein [Longimicrobium sp.]